MAFPYQVTTLGDFHNLNNDQIKQILQHYNLEIDQNDDEEENIGQLKNFLGLLNSNRN